MQVELRALRPITGEYGHVDAGGKFSLDDVAHRKTLIRLESKGLVERCPLPAAPLAAETLVKMEKEERENKMLASVEENKEEKVARKPISKKPQAKRRGRPRKTK